MRESISLMLLTCLVGVASSGGAAAQTVLVSVIEQHQNDMSYMVGDIDGDGLRDFLVHRWGPGVGYYIRMDVYSSRSGSLLLGIGPSPGTNFYHTRLGDVDGDGREDLGVDRRVTSSGGVQKFLEVVSGSTGLVLRSIAPSPSGQGGPYLMDDINGDGKAEYVVFDFRDVGGLVLAGQVDVIDGATGLVLRSHVGMAYELLRALPAELGDIDGDGFIDYVLASDSFPGPNAWRVHSGATGSLITIYSPIGDQIGIGDVNADGYEDVLQDWNVLGSYVQRVLAGPAFSQVLWSNSWVPASTPQYVYSAGRMGDFDGDGHSDFAVVDGQSGQTFMLSGRNQTVVVSYPPFGAIFLGIYRLLDSPGDVDGDGYPELMMGGGTTPSSATVNVVSGAPPGVSLFGAACTDQTGQIPRIGVGVGARLGKTLTVNLSNANPGLLAAVLGLGFSDLTWGGTALPLSLAFLNMPNCSWYVSGDVALTLPTVGLNGTRHHATHTIPVPAVTSLLGTSLYGQWLVLESGPNGLTGSTTRAVRTTVVP